MEPHKQSPPARTENSNVFEPAEAGFFCVGATYSRLVFYLNFCDRRLLNLKIALFDSLTPKGRVIGHRSAIGYQLLVYSNLRLTTYKFPSISFLLAQ
ncbi:hypothetical protein [Scytonema millei]|uniref:Uncharacterized protein n=1 Tax=Scytonema millei VB511283 TaxID=1245923 RepID=A0A9X5E652_9CYAN|nr:hypothetical protein [Scytonema millei]NHC34752.1 hypothetical protein [Scytonema millei VB511283]